MTCQMALLQSTLVVQQGVLSLAPARLNLVNAFLFSLTPHEARRLGTAAFTTSRPAHSPPPGSAFTAPHKGPMPDSRTRPKSCSSASPGSSAPGSPAAHRAIRAAMPACALPWQSTGSEEGRAAAEEGTTHCQFVCKSGSAPLPKSLNRRWQHLQTNRCSQLEDIIALPIPDPLD